MQLLAFIIVAAVLKAVEKVSSTFDEQNWNLFSLEILLDFNFLPLLSLGNSASNASIFIITQQKK